MPDAHHDFSEFTHTQHIVQEIRTQTADLLIDCQRCITLGLEKEDLAYKCQ